jgi:hypothetical protein
LRGFNNKSLLELTSFAPGSTEKISFSESGDKTNGVLTITDGFEQASITLFGQYVAAGFHMGSDGHGGTAVTYGASSPFHIDLAAAYR